VQVELVLSRRDQHRRDRSSDGLTSSITVKTEFEKSALFTARFHGIFFTTDRIKKVTKYTPEDSLNGSGARGIVVLLSAVVDHGEMKRKGAMDGAAEVKHEFYLCQNSLQI
jgi:hypothetical protein